MYTYSTNYMGPALHWYESNHIPYVDRTSFSTLFNREITFRDYEQYCGGRIDVYGPDLHYPDSVYIPIMRCSSWNAFSDWLDTFSSDTILDFDQLYVLYGKPLDIFQEDSCNTQTDG